MEPDRAFTLVLASSAAMRSALPSDAMGAAPRPADGTRRTRAYAFLNKVQSFAARHRLVVMQVLACVLAPLRPGTNVALNPVVMSGLSPGVVVVRAGVVPLPATSSPGMAWPTSRKH